MIVIGVDVHKHSLTAVAVDEAGRQLDELTLDYPDAPLFEWAASLGEVRLWAVEDCRHVTRAPSRWPTPARATGRRCRSSSSSGAAAAALARTRARTPAVEAGHAPVPHS